MPLTVSNKCNVNTPISNHIKICLLLSFYKFSILLWVVSGAKVKIATIFGLTYLYKTLLSLKTLPWECTCSIASREPIAITWVGLLNCVFHTSLAENSYK